MLLHDYIGVMFSGINLQNYVTSIFIVGNVAFLLKPSAESLSKLP